MGGRLVPAPHKSQVDDEMTKLSTSTRGLDQGKKS